MSLYAKDALWKALQSGHKLVTRLSRDGHGKRSKTDRVLYKFYEYEVPKASLRPFGLWSQP